MNELKSTSTLLPAARQEGDALVASFSGEIDLNNSPELRAALFALLDQIQPKRVILNLAGVPYMDSSAIAVLVELLRRMGKGPNKVFLTNLQPRVRGLLEIARLNTIFVVTENETEALAKAARSAAAPCTHVSTLPQSDSFATRPLMPSNCSAALA